MQHRKQLAAVCLLTLLGGCAGYTYRALGPGVLEVSAPYKVVQDALWAAWNPPATTQPMLSKIRGTEWTSTQTGRYVRKGASSVAEVRDKDGHLYRVETLSLPNRPVLVVIEPDFGGSDAQDQAEFRFSLEKALQRSGVSER